MIDRVATLAVVLCWLAMPAAAQVFYGDDPLLADPDALPLDTPPAEHGVSDYYDAISNLLGSPGEADGPAPNVNTVGDVPASSWYARRNYYEPMTPAEAARGPNTTGGPADGPWRVVDLKNQGVSLGLTIEDARGDRYLLKFDQPEHHEMASAAEVVSTKLAYALGYHTPENYVAYFTPDRLVPDTSEGITQADVDALVHRLHVYADGPHEGQHRALASRYLEGQPLGAFSYSGTRSDDPNDLFPHEARRELRGLRLAAAWIDHFDARAMNSLDMVVEGPDGPYVKHYLIDFGSTLGGGPLGPKKRWYGSESALELWPIIARTWTLGFGASDWMTVEYPNDWDAVGFFESDHFDPEAWTPGLPNPAFERMDAQDGFWMAKQIMAVTDEQLRAIVETAEYTEPGAADYVAQTLAERRDKIGRAYLPLGGGLDRFRVESGRLVFDDLLRRYSLAEPEGPREVVWNAFDNATGDLGAALGQSEVEGDSVPLPSVLTAALDPAALGPAGYVAATIRTPGVGVTRVYLRQTPAGYRVVGVQRGPQAPTPGDGWG